MNIREDGSFRETYRMNPHHRHPYKRLLDRVLEWLRTRR